MNDTCNECGCRMVLHGIGPDDYRCIMPSCNPAAVAWVLRHNLRSPMGRVMPEQAELLMRVAA